MLCPFSRMVAYLLVCSLGRSSFAFHTFKYFLRGRSTNISFSSLQSSWALFPRVVSVSPLLTAKTDKRLCVRSKSVLSHSRALTLLGRSDVFPHVCNNAVQFKHNWSLVMFYLLYFSAFCSKCVVFFVVLLVWWRLRVGTMPRTKQRGPYYFFLKTIGNHYYTVVPLKQRESKLGT